VRDVQKQAIADILPALRDEDNLSDEDLAAGEELLRDRVTVFRFCRRARFSPSAALKLLHSTVHWRLTSSLRYLEPSAIHARYLTKPLFFFHPSLVDRFGRPCAILNLRYVQRTEDGTLDALKDYARLGWEIGRRYLSDLSRKAGEDQDPKLQMVVIVDLEGAGMSNLEMELLPFFLDLLKSHFPGMVGAIFVLNYGWAYAGMWQLAKRVLPNTALERILFPNKDELLEFFDEDNLLVEHGGKVHYEYTPANPILEKYGRSTYPPSSATSSRGPTPSASSASLNAEVFHSAPGTRSTTPAASPRVRTLDLAMTPTLRASDSGFFSRSNSGSGSSRRLRAGESGSTGGLRRVRSFAELQQKLEQTQREIDSEDSIDDSASDDVGSLGEGPGEGDESEISRTASGTASGRSSRFSSRATSRAVSREVSPVRRRGLDPLTAALGQQERQSSIDMTVMSPYNASNPHFGYPAYVPTSNQDATGIPRPRHLRRRKRDLLRTLTYLAALRFLALHRAIQYRLNVLIALLLRITGIGWWRAGRAAGFSSETVGRGRDTDKRVHWAESQTATPLPSSSGSSSHSSSSSSLSAIVPPQPHHSHHAAHPSALAARATSPSSGAAAAAASFIDVDPSFVYLFLLFLVVRTPRRREKLKSLVRFVAVGAPTWTASKARAGVLRLLLGREAAARVLAAERGV
ncbi:SEC14 family lipid-binding protein, partial [Rhodotorula paludigena]|uniref:SEC14 family lipid-binding protein n=1 Tax=Rhodotorula paludigena TaxID=86838 RepID=UPI003174F893